MYEFRRDVGRALDEDINSGDWLWYKDEYLQYIGNIYLLMVDGHEVRIGKAFKNAWYAVVVIDDKYSESVSLKDTKVIEEAVEGKLDVDVDDFQVG